MSYSCHLEIHVLKYSTYKRGYWEFLPLRKAWYKILQLQFMVQTIQIFTDLILGTIIGEVIVWMMGLKNIIPAEVKL